MFSVDDAPTKPTIMSLQDYRAKLAAYRAVIEAERGDLDGPITTWETVCLACDAYREYLESGK